jgi:transcriptional regulator with PAS, ATPase and Fis domain
VTCLILGPNGSGKERLARYIHDQSARREQPYRAINCAAFSDELLRSELFGHKKGSFTGADKDRIGILESADAGTVFLDEIGDISPIMQVALLRVLQEKEIQPIGENQQKKINIRIIAATNRNLKEDCKAGKFRWDLYYRLNVAPLEITPLFAQGKQVIKEWIQIKVSEYAKDFGNIPLKILHEALEKLQSYSWPGNIRELEHTILRLYTFRNNYEHEINIKDLPTDILFPEGTGFRLKDAEKELIEKVLRMTNNNLSRSCEILDITRNTLKDRLKKYSLDLQGLGE